LQNAFWRNRNETDPEKIKTLIAKGDFIVKELETEERKREEDNSLKGIFLDSMKMSAMIFLLSINYFFTRKFSSNHTEPLPLDSFFVITA
uniref:Uncharacterized protein n=1 Tax=Parascaris equorum TaxID=6256 RepID=A0A914RMD1_PAREQ